MTSTVAAANVSARPTWKRGIVGSLLWRAVPLLAPAAVFAIYVIVTRPLFVG